MYFFVYLIFAIISLIPFSGLYVISDILYFFIFKLLKYRRSIVFENLRQAFPEKDAACIESIAGKFYKSLCDQLVETVKITTLSRKSLMKRISCDWDYFNNAELQYRQIYLLLGHQFNWEWANLASGIKARHLFAGFYLPLKNRVFEKLMLKLRCRTGNMMVPANHFYHAFKTLDGQAFTLAFLADQVPGSPKIASWYNFLNRPAAFFNGPEKLARKHNAAVFFISLERLPQRGYYHLGIHDICNEAAATEPGFIIGKYVTLLEESIRNQPENWLWSHRRWKWTMPGESTLNQKF